MKKITKKMKGKKVLSLVLAAIMLATTFNMALPMLKLDAGAADGYVTNGTIASTGITQTRVVGTTNDAYKATYAAYASDYLDGCSEPTDIVIPGLDPAQDYVIQGMTYYPKEDWFFVTAYYNGSNVSSKVFCLDAATGEFVALLDFYDVGTQNLNTDHGGGIAISEHNIYYSCGDKDRSIAYAPLSALDGITKGEYRTIQLIGEQTFFEVGSVTEANNKNVDNGGVDSAYTAYVCYDQGVLWMGNFFDSNSGDYGKKANASYDNMVFGYRLSGSTSAEEWANLTSNTQNCQGNPSYVIALGDDSSGIDIKWVQYATVDSGKLYLSRSASTGGNKLGNMYDKYSHLTVADIDLTTPGTSSITILTDAAGTQRTVTNAYVLSSYHDYPMMPMSEGLCVVDDYLFVTYEGASNKFLNEAGSGIGGLVNDNCPEPVDVIWKVDQYELLGVRRDDNRETACYEKVDDISSINNTDEYIVVYESDEKNPVTQEHILYALDSHGGHNGFNLPKEGLNNQNDTTKPDHTVGIVGHKISEYDIDGNKLYLTYPEEDDVENIRWKFVGSNGSYTLKNSSKYFTEYHTLQVSGVEASMAKSTSIGITLTDMGETWRIQSGGEYLWCNDGTHSLENTINSYYTSYCNNKGVASYTEQPGTFHSNATGTSNVLGRALTTSEDSYREFEIYKRVIDEYASTEESRVYTSMDAALQEDGTYTINLETYATAETQYQTLKNERPTDFIFVLDASASMTGKDSYDCSGYQKYDGDLSPYSVAGSGDIDSGAYTMSGGNIYVRFGDEMYLLTVESSTPEGRIIAGSGTQTQYFWLSYKDNNGTQHWWVLNDRDNAENGGYWSKDKPGVDKAMKASCTYALGIATNEEREDAWVYYGEHYQFKESSGTSRLCCMQSTVQMLAGKIKEDSLEHRIALVQYGSDAADVDGETSLAWLNTGMFYKGTDNNGNAIGKSQKYEGEASISEDIYKNAFFNKEDFGIVCDALWSINTSGGDSDTYVNYGFDMANGIINNSGNDYLATGDRNVAVIMITDGVPGKGSDYPDIANTVTDLAIAETYEAKCNGASVYSVQMGNNSIDGFSMNLYMDAVSSEYVTAKSRIDLGDRNPDSIDYHIDVPVGTTEMFNAIADSVFNSVQANSKAGLVHLDTASIIREELKDAFIIDDATFSAALIPGSYDKIGRMSFGEPVSKTLSAKEKYAECVNGEIAYNQDTENKNKLEIWGYNYTDQYISQSHPGNKLRITITGVLADHTVDLTNTSINNNSTTAIYRDSTWLGKERAFKYFPTEYFTIPEYTYVLDYGFDMYDDDVNGTMLALDEGPYKQDTSNYSRSIKSKMVAITEDSQDLIYSHNPAYVTDSGYVLIERDEDGRAGTYDWFEIKVVPASNVYYEETSITLPTVDDTAKSDWISTGESTIEYQDLTAEGDVYGYDSNYMNSTGFSGGTHYIATVDSSTKKSETASFTFKGTGFDLISACGDSTGIQIVKLYKNGVAEKGYIVDTYYKDANVAPMLYQVPIVSYSGEYAKYTVETTAAYLTNAGAFKNTRSVANSTSKYLMNGISQTSSAISGASLDGILADLDINLDFEDIEVVWMDDNSVLNGGTGPRGNAKRGRSTSTTTTTTSLINYIDGFRIYNPMDSDTSAYVPSEQSAQYVNVANHLATDKDSLFAYIEGSTIASTNFAEYNANGGPKNEVYLSNANNQGLAFQVSIPSNSSKVMLGLRAVTGSPKIKINGVEADEAISSATEMYYDITEYIKQANGGSLPVNAETPTIITISNVGTGILAVNNAKFSGVEVVQDALTLENATRSLFASYGTLSEVTAKNEAINEPEEDTPTEEEQSPNVPDLFSIIIAFIEKLMSLLSRFVGLA